MIYDPKLKYAVLFDTNAYRQIVYKKNVKEINEEIQDLKEAETRKDIIPYGIFMVALEMLNHLTKDKINDHFIDCKKGLIALSNHCNNLDNTFRIAATPYLQIVHSYFDDIDKSEEANILLLNSILNVFVNNSESQIESLISNSKLQNLSKVMEQEESDFSSNIIGFIESVKDGVKNDYPKSDKKMINKEMIRRFSHTDCIQYFSKKIIESIIQKLKLEITETEVTNISKDLSIQFPLISSFIPFICKKIVNDNIDMNSKSSKKKRWNWLWDYHVASLISFHKLSGNTVIIVTSDQDLKEIIDTNFKDALILTIEEYLNSLNCGIKLNKV